MIYLLILFGCIAVIYIIKYYFLTANLKKTTKQIDELKQNPEQNRILFFSYPNKESEKLLGSINEYIAACRQQQIASINRERDLRTEIENISHDLRTPLTAILGYVELLNQEKLSEETKEALTIIQKKSKYLQRLISNFYDLSRLELNDYHLIMETVDLTRFSRETILSYFQEFELKSLSVNLEMDNTPVSVLADYGALERIFSNVIQNALRYAKNYFYVFLIKENDFVSIIFENDTTNLSEEDASHLFERFYVKDNSRTLQSTGLGLTIARLLTKAMGGDAKAIFKNNSLQLIFTFCSA